ncbi:MAG: CAP domain-containing protein [Chloroflexi bacterium]|nr:CAP domain-containing protein [Chloroflexota bacterium]MCI0800216.1 CAP domain-containing protein [Chloroflexota bacterium]MCI0896440.1 CAP domain-containing protein [Chloroflexota bacterium]
MRLFAIFTGILLVAAFSIACAPSSDSDTTTATLSSISLPDLRIYLLGLINHDRQANGVDPVTLGHNSAAQKHAEEMLTHSYLSHWGLDGMKPYMRYTLAGGVNYEAENTSGVSTPRQPGLRYRTISPKGELRKIHRGWMESSGHRANVLSPWHKQVNLGIACSRTTCAAVEQFAGEYVEFSERPTLTNGVLFLAGQLAGDFEFANIHVWYEPPPHSLTLGQLDRTYCYSVGTALVAFIREPPPPGTYYTPDRGSYMWDKCPSPYDVPPDAPRVIGIAVPPPEIGVFLKVPWITARSWKVAEGSFWVEADLTGAIANYGAGVYTVLLWGNNGGKDVALTRYSIFVE